MRSAASVEDYKLLEALNQATSEKLGELSGKASAMREGDAVPAPPSSLLPLLSSPPPPPFPLLLYSNRRFLHCHVLAAVVKVCFFLTRTAVRRCMLQEPKP